MENTQVIDWDAEEEEETEISSGSLGYSVEPIGRLRFFSGTHGPERDFPLYLGKNVVGRSPDCSVALPFPSISKQHAVIEISAWNKAPILQDCGSLNGTQIVKPPRVLAPGVSHRLRDQELILFADFPCQYHRLNVPPPLVPRSLLTIEKTPRIRGRSQNSRVLLAEDSEEEGDFPSGRSVANGSRNTASPSATVVPESDEEGSSPGPSVPGPSSPFGLGSDTDESQGQQPGVEESSLADNSGAAGEPEQPEVNGVTTGTLAQPTKDKFKDTKMKEEAGSAGVPVGSVVEGSPTLGEDSDTEADEERQPSGSGDSDTDVEEERVPVKKNQVLLGVGIGGPGARGVAHLQDSPTGSDTDVEEDKTALAAPPERSHTAMVINSDTDEEERGEEEEVSAALTLARLKERGIALWSGEPGTEEVKSQPQVLVERSQSASGRDSDTDVEEGSSGGKREIVPDSPMDVDETLTVTQPESQPPCRPNDVDEDVDMSSPGSHLEGKKASSALVDKNRAQVEEEVPGPSVTLGEKHQVPLEGAQPPEEARETAVQEGSSSPVADIRMSQQPVAEDAGTECAAAVSEQKSALEVGAQSRSPAAPVEQVVVRTDTSGDPTLPQREGAQTPTGREREAHVGGTKHAKECCDEPEDLCLSATQCFVEGESQHPGAVQSLEDEPTQVFPCLPQEPGPSHLSLPTPGADTLDVPWEVLATQPFCLREQTETSEPIDTHEAHGSQPSLPGEPPGHQHPVPTSLDHTELLRIDDREMQTVEKAMGHLSCQMMPDGKASGDDPEPSDHRLFSPVPEASASPQSLLTSQSQKQSTPQPMFPTSSSELALPETLHTKPNVRPRRSSRMTPSPHSSAALKPYTTCPTNQPAASRPTSRPTRGRANRSSTRTPELIVPTGPELQPSTSTEQPGIPNLTSQVTEGRAHSTSVNMPEPVLTGPEAQPLTSAEQSVTSNLNPRGRQSRSSVKTPQPLISTGPDLQPPTSTEQPVVPKSTSRTTRGRPPKSSVRTPESVVPTGSESLTSIEQPVIPKTRAARGRSSKPSIKTPEPIVPTGPELQPLTSAEQPVTPNLTSRASRGRSNKSIRTPEPVVQTGPEFHPSTSSEQSDTPEPSSQGRTRRSVRTPEASVSTTPALQPSTSKKQPTPKPTALVTRGRTHKPSTEGLESVGPVAPDFEPPTSTDHLVTSKVTGQSLTLQSSPVSASPVSTTPELKPPVLIAQPLTLEPVPQTSHQRRRRATGKQGSRTAPVGPKSYSTPAEPEPQSSASQSSGASEADSPHQKRPRRQVTQKTVVVKEEDPGEIQVKEEPQETAIPTPGKRKRDPAEGETQGNPTRSRRTKPNQEAAAPKVLFTGVVDSRGERAVLALGGSLASSVNEASHLVTDRIRRTVKFLCAVGKGIPILSLNWLYQSRKAGCFLPPDDYLVTDPEQEKNFSFSLRDSLSRARERRLLEDYEIHVTPGVQPPPPQMGEIISCCGGTVLPSMPHSYKLHRVVITCTEDLPRCAIASRLGLPLLSPEFLLTGVLKQEATPEAFVLSNLEM